MFATDSMGGSVWSDNHDLILLSSFVVLGALILKLLDQ
jgi:hypothetical protein